MSKAKRPGRDQLTAGNKLLLGISIFWIGCMVGDHRQFSRMSDCFQTRPPETDEEIRKFFGYPPGTQLGYDTLSAFLAYKHKRCLLREK